MIPATRTPPSSHRKAVEYSNCIVRVLLVIPYAGSGLELFKTQKPLIKGTNVSPKALSSCTQLTYSNRPSSRQTRCSELKKKQFWFFSCLPISLLWITSHRTLRGTVISFHFIPFDLQYAGTLRRRLQPSVVQRLPCRPLHQTRRHILTSVSRPRRRKQPVSHISQHPYHGESLQVLHQALVR